MKPSFKGSNKYMLFYLIFTLMKDLAQVLKFLIVTVQGFQGFL